ncbi:unnamed protein product [Sympodiomycopsis kandeliae]
MTNQTTQPKSIPLSTTTTRQQTINDLDRHLLSDTSNTTTNTSGKLMYSRNELLNLSQSPLSKSPSSNFKHFPADMIRRSSQPQKDTSDDSENRPPNHTDGQQQQQQFQLDL